MRSSLQRRGSSRVLLYSGLLVSTIPQFSGRKTEDIGKKAISIGMIKVEGTMMISSPP